VGLQRLYAIRESAVSSLASSSCRTENGIATPIGGYIHRNTFDTLASISGYRPHFGLIVVDRKIFVRTPTPSASHPGKFTWNTKV